MVCKILTNCFRISLSVCNSCSNFRNSVVVDNWKSGNKLYLSVAIAWLLVSGLVSKFITKFNLFIIIFCFSRHASIINIKDTNINSILYNIYYWKTNRAQIVKNYLILLLQHVWHSVWFCPFSAMSLSLITGKPSSSRKRLLSSGNFII